MDDLLTKIKELTIDQQADLFSQLKNHLRSTVEKKIDEGEKSLEFLKKILGSVNN